MELSSHGARSVDCYDCILGILSSSEKSMKLGSHADRSVCYKYYILGSLLNIE